MSKFTAALRKTGSTIANGAGMVAKGAGAVLEIAAEHDRQLREAAAAAPTYFVALDHSSLFVQTYKVCAAVNGTVQDTPITGWDRAALEATVAQLNGQVAR